MNYSEKILEKETEYALEHNTENPIDSMAFRETVLEILKEAGYGNVDICHAEEGPFGILTKAQKSYYRWLGRNRDRFAKEQTGTIIFGIESLDTYEGKINFIAEEVQEDFREIAVAANEPELFGNKKTREAATEKLNEKFKEFPLFILYEYPEADKGRDLVYRAKELFDEWVQEHPENFRARPARDFGRGFLSGLIGGFRGR